MEKEKGKHHIHDLVRFVLYPLLAGFETDFNVFNGDDANGIKEFLGYILHLAGQQSVNGLIQNAADHRSLKFTCNLHKIVKTLFSHGSTDMIHKGTRLYPFIALLCAVLHPHSLGAQQPTRYMIVVTGDELLSGVYADGHTYFITRTLHPLGLSCVGSMCVSDQRTDMRAALTYAQNKADLILVTGGLGPTDNDITREVLTDFTGISLREDPQTLGALAKRFKRSPDDMRLNLRRQVLVPASGTTLKNSQGTALGLVFDSNETVTVALPGPPRELQAMVRDELIPYLTRRFGTRPLGCTLTLRFVGLGQSQISQTLSEHASLDRDIILSSQFEGGRVDFTFALPDNSAENRARLAQLKQTIMTHLGDSVYADSSMTLEQHVLQLLAKKNVTLALAEVGSSGHLAAALNPVPAAERVLVGAFVAPSAKKVLQLVEASPVPIKDTPSTDRLAKATAQATGSSLILIIGPIQRPADKSPYVDVAMYDGDKLEIRTMSVRGSGELAHERLTTQVLDILRRKYKN